MKLRILHVTYDMRIGGTEMVIKNIIESDYDIFLHNSIFCIEGVLGPWGRDLQERGIPITLHRRRQGFDIALVKALRKYILDSKIDIVHCHQYTPWVYGALSSIGLKAKVIFTEHGRFYPDSGSWKRKLVNPILTKLTARITAISHATGRALADFESIPEKYTEIVYNGIHFPTLQNSEIAQARDELNISSDSVILGTIARFDPIKNHSMMLSAFKDVLAKHPNTILVMIGDGDERQNIKRIIAELSLENNVILTGYKENPLPFLANMDIFLLSSLSEGTSMTLLEAMALKKPCVVTDAGGNSEIIKNNINGFVTENDNPAAFSKAICELIESKTLQYKFSDNARRIFFEKFHAKIMTKKYQDLYEAIC